MASFLTEIRSLTRSQSLFVLFAMLTNFLIAGEYSIVRPVSQSIFLNAFSAETIPFVWLATVPLNFLIVCSYNRFLPRIGAFNMLFAISAAIAGLNGISAVLIPIFPKLSFIHFCLKDIYILLMFKQLWSQLHNSGFISKGTGLYGLIFAAGTLGSVAGCFIPYYYAISFGSEKLLLCSIPIYALIVLFYYQIYRSEDCPALSPKASEGGAFASLAKSPYLLGVLLLVACMQISVAFVEYRFNHQLEIEFPVKDIRTAYCGWLIGLVHVISMCAQLAGSIFLVRILGLKRSHFLVPTLLCTAMAGEWIAPGFAMAAFLYVLIKSLDFSFFNIIREMLFVPLKTDEKFRAKAIIDVFGHRTSKAFASVLLIGIQFIAGSAVFQFANYLAIVIFIVWLAAVSVLFHKYYRDPSSQTT